VQIFTYVGNMWAMQTPTTIWITKCGSVNYLYPNKFNDSRGEKTFIVDVTLAEPYLTNWQTIHNVTTNVENTVQYFILAWWTYSDVIRLPGVGLDFTPVTKCFIIIRTTFTDEILSSNIDSHKVFSKCRRVVPIALFERIFEIRRDKRQCGLTNR